MTLQRRQFMRSAATGMALGFANCGVVLADTGTVKGELQGGSGILQLEGPVKKGYLKLEAQDFVDRSDHSVIIRGKFDSTDLYSAMFAYDYDGTVFALFNDSGHSTTLVFSGTGRPQIGRLVVWNDTETPKTFDIDKTGIMKAGSWKDIVDSDGKSPNLLGNRKPPDFTWRDLEAAFGSNPALQKFMRGRKSTHDPPPDKMILDAACRLVSLVPGSMLSLGWLGGR